MLLDEGWLAEARRVPSPHYDCRPDDENPSLLVVHNISLPPGEFGGPWIDALFTGTIDPNAHPYFAGIAHLRVSAHCLIRRDGEIVQYVPFDKRAWHAGVSSYHAYLNAAARDDAHARDAMASELTLIHGVPPDCDEREFLRELQNALLWNNFRFYLAPLFWLIVGGPWGPVTLVGYAFLRAWQSWLARYQTPHQRLQSGIDAILHVLDWIPVRLAGVVYALLGHGEKALPAWFASLADLHTSQYQVLTRLAQFSLAREPHTDKVETPKAAVSLAKKTSFVVVVVIAVLTIYGALV